MGFLGFLAKKKFYYSLGLSVLITLILVLVSFRIIKSYTNHGEALKLPDFQGLTLEQLEENKYTAVFDFIVTDSVFSSDAKPGSIIKQNPSPDSKVKRGRNVYITVVAMTPEMTLMPDLKDLTVRQAVSSLKSSGLKIGKLLFVPDMADNAVLGQYFAGDTLLTGDELIAGSEIDLLIGKENNNPAPIPFLIGLTESSAIDLVHISSFNTGKVMYMDTLAERDGKVYKQTPLWTGELERGGVIDIWLRSSSLYNFDSLIETLMPDSAYLEENIMELPEDTVIF
jgi:beta-lactam-binding protein with PASTA domain